MLQTQHGAIQEVTVNVIGPWKITCAGQGIVFNALTCIDTVTNWVELIRINNRTAAHVAKKFADEWLSRYPRPDRCVHDPGPEFMGMAFVNMLYQNGITNAPTTAKNPQANAICECMHQAVGNSLRAMTHAHPPEGLQQAIDIVDTCLANAAYATRTVIHHTLNILPGALIFQRDMILNIPLIADLERLQQK